MWLDSLRGVNIKNIVLLEVTSWSLADAHQRFKWAYSASKVEKMPSYPINGGIVTL
jgi:hypothetical protein